MHGGICGTGPQKHPPPPRVLRGRDPHGGGGHVEPLVLHVFLARLVLAYQGSKECNGLGRHHSKDPSSKPSSFTY